MPLIPVVIAGGVTLAVGYGFFKILNYFMEPVANTCYIANEYIGVYHPEGEIKDVVKPNSYIDCRDFEVEFLSKFYYAGKSPQKLAEEIIEKCLKDGVLNDEILMKDLNTELRKTDSAREIRKILINHRLVFPSDVLFLDVEELIDLTIAWLTVMVFLKDCFDGKEIEKIIAPL